MAMGEATTRQDVTVLTYNLVIEPILVLIRDGIEAHVSGERWLSTSHRALTTLRTSTLALPIAMARCCRVRAGETDRRE